MQQIDEFFKKQAQASTPNKAYEQFRQLYGDNTSLIPSQGILTRSTNFFTLKQCNNKSHVIPQSRLTKKKRLQKSYFFNAVNQRANLVYYSCQCPHCHCIEPEVYPELIDYNHLYSQLYKANGLYGKEIIVGIRDGMVVGLAGWKAGLLRVGGGWKSGQHMHRDGKGPWFCPYSGLYLFMPSFSVKCQHPPCYMAYQYVISQLRQSRKFRCTVCNKYLDQQDIVVDESARQQQLQTASSIFGQKQSLFDYFMTVRSGQNHFISNMRKRAAYIKYSKSKEVCYQINLQNVKQFPAQCEHCTSITQYFCLQEQLHKLLQCQREEQTYQCPICQHVYYNPSPSNFITNIQLSIQKHNKHNHLLAFPLKERYLLDSLDQSHSKIDNCLPPLTLSSHQLISLPDSRHCYFSYECQQKDAQNMHFTKPVKKDDGWACPTCSIKLSVAKLRSVQQFYVEGVKFEIGEGKGFFNTQSGRVIKNIMVCGYEELEECKIDIGDYRLKLDDRNRDDPVILKGCQSCPLVVYSLRQLKQQLPDHQCSQPRLMTRYRRIDPRQIPADLNQINQLQLHSYDQLKQLEMLVEETIVARSFAVVADRRYREVFQERDWNCLRKFGGK